jgi:ABC-type lipopolysaccharide export system ATPase subunit
MTSLQALRLSLAGAAAVVLLSGSALADDSKAFKKLGVCEDLKEVMTQKECDSLAKMAKKKRNPMLEDALKKVKDKKKADKLRADLKASGLY